MPRTSCVEHSRRSYFVAIRDTYLVMCDQDYCAAALLAVMEYLCNGELDRLGEEETEDSMPWFSVPISEINRCMLGLYSGRAIQDAMAKIEKIGLLDVERRGLGKNNRYRFRYDRVQEAINKRYVFDGNFSVEHWALDGTLDGTLDGKNDVEISVHTLVSKKEEKEREQHISEKAPELEQQSTQSGTDSALTEFEQFAELGVDSISDWMQHEFQMHHGRTATRPSKKSLLRAQSGFELLGESKFRAAFADFLTEGGRSIDDFAKRFSNSQARQERPKFAAPASVARSSGFRRTDRTAEPPVSRPTPSQAPEAALEWNRVIPDRAWKIWTIELAELWETAKAEGIEQHWPDVLQAARKAVESGDQAKNGFLTLAWVLKKWANIVNGCLRWLSSGSQSARGTNAVEEALAMVGDA